jgi:hypothetical protein
MGQPSVPFLEFLNEYCAGDCPCLTYCADYAVWQFNQKVDDRKVLKYSQLKFYSQRKIFAKNGQLKRTVTQQMIQQRLH